MPMSDNSKSIYFAIFGAGYFVFTTIVAGHGVHWMNSVITLGILLLSGYYFLKSREQTK